MNTYELDELVSKGEGFGKKFHVKFFFKGVRNGVFCYMRFIWFINLYIRSVSDWFGACLGHIL